MPPPAAMQPPIMSPRSGRSGVPSSFQDDVDLPGNVDEDYNCLLRDSRNGHGLSAIDPDSPMMWPTWKRVYASAVASVYVFVILYGTTTYTAAMPLIPRAFGVSQLLSVLGFVNPFFGIFFAPIVTPHLAERYGRRPVYNASFATFTLCVLGVGLTRNFSTLIAFRFLGGLFAGPCLVLIEGTFADLWSAEWTVTYYAFLTMASFLGAAAGPILGNIVLFAFGPSWLTWFTLLFAILALIFGSGMPETYSREILRTRIRYTRTHTHLLCAPSGVRLSEMLRITGLTPLKMLVTEPIVLMITLFLGLNFGLVFQFFVTVPLALREAYHFGGRQSGMAFFAAVGGAIVALIASVLLEALLATPGKQQRDASGLKVTPIERRLVPAIAGGVLAAGALFWVGFGVNPAISPIVPIVGTGVYVWGNAMVLISLISYLFDVYPAASLLSALTMAACFRILCAGLFPLFILDIISALPQGWGYGVFGAITAVFTAFPILLMVLGPKLRKRSRYNQDGLPNAVQLEVMVTRQEEVMSSEMAAARRKFQELHPQAILPKSEFE